MGDAAPARLHRIAFWFLRHGQTDWNAQDLAQGDIDIPLNATGIAQAHTAAAALRHAGIATIVSSPLTRARVTAEIAGEVVGRPVTFDDGLREVKFGVMEGKPMLAPWFTAWIEGKATPEGAESFAELRARCVAAFNRALAKPAPVLIVAHGALFRAARAEMGLEPNFRTRNGWPFFCEPPSKPGDAVWTLTEAPGT